MLRKLGFLLLISAAALLLPSCASDSEQKKDDSSNVSSIPWNRPEKWENGSSLPGGMMGTQ